MLMSVKHVRKRRCKASLMATAGLNNWKLLAEVLHICDWRMLIVCC